MAEVYSVPQRVAASDGKLVDSPYQRNDISAIGAGIGASLGLMATHFFIWWGYGGVTVGSDSLNLPLIFGSFLTNDYVGAQVLGLGAMVGFYTVVAWTYAFLLALFRFQSNGAKGVLFGFLAFVPIYAFILPWTIGLSARWGIPHVNSSFLPNMDVMLHQAAQGNLGWEAVALVAVEHLLYGLLLGCVYRHKELPIGRGYRLRYLGD